MAAVLAAFAALFHPTRARAAGPWIDARTLDAEAAAGPSACSSRHPLCVLSARGTEGARVGAALAAADAAWGALVDVLDLPAPDPDPAGGGRWRLVLADGVSGGAHAELAERDPQAAFDRASSFGVVDRATATGCPLEAAVARAVADGVRWREAPATDEGSARAEAQMLAALVTPCAAPDEGGATFQASPERAVVDPADARFGAGAARFFGWLDRSFAGGSGALVAGLWALAPTQTPLGASRWASSPTGFDVMRKSLAGALGTDSDLDDVLLAFAIDRATVSPSPRLDWHVPWPRAARRLASAFPVAPTGAAYVLVDHAQAQAGDSLRVSATWEDYGRMRWAVVKMDAAGHPTATLPIATQRLATTASITVELLDGVDHLLVVGANVGSTEHPFDPSQGWWEPHGWILTLDGR